MAGHAEFVICEQSIERTFAWILRNRRMSRDYEFLAETTEALIYVCMVRLMVKRLANEAA
jgi:putative transposase